MFDEGLAVVKADDIKVQSERQCQVCAMRRRLASVTPVRSNFFDVINV